MWSLIADITSKSDWYTKVFDQDIVDKWVSEIPNSNIDAFNFVLGLLQASAQGYIPARQCNHVEQYACIPCHQEFLSKLSDAGFASAHKIKTTKVAAAVKLGLNAIDTVDQLDLEESIFEHMSCTHFCDCVPANTLLSDYVVYKECDSPTKLLELVNHFCEIEAPSWHPGSNNTVRNIIHPSLHCYIKGTTKHLNGEVKHSYNEATRYQWLPSDFHVSKTGKVKITSRINGLDQHYSAMIPELEFAFAGQLKSFEQVMKTKLTDTTLQVIAKIARVELSTEKACTEYDGGSWHVEGTPYEHIIAASVQYLEVTGLTPSFLEFRKPTVINEENVDYIQNDEKYTTHHFGIKGHHDGTMHMNLGNIRCNTDKYVVFPNIIQHRVMPFKLADQCTEGTRTILAFFVINPSVRILSVDDVIDSRGYITDTEALEHRSRLMTQRKFFVDELNEEVFLREFSLCEH